MGMGAENDRLQRGPTESFLSLFSIDPATPRTEFAVFKQGIGLLNPLGQFTFSLQRLVSWKPVLFFLYRMRTGGREEQRAAKEKGILDEMAACQSHDGLFWSGKATLVFLSLC
jgi:hypothetical protein